MGGKPHDVILDPQANYAYVTVLGLPGENDFVVQYSTESFEEVGRAAVGKDPHVSLTQRNKLLYVPSQGSNAVYILNRLTMEQVDVLEIPGAHGAGMAFSGKYFYTTNLPGGGDDALYTIDTNTGTIVGEATDAPYSVPHNIVLTTEMDRLFLTHSGPTSDKVTFYSVNASDPQPVLLGEATVGFNPFGLAFVP
jgi:DNA-binding beta-propeller fold protein YncE